VSARVATYVGFMGDEPSWSAIYRFWDALKRSRGTVCLTRPSSGKGKPEEERSLANAPLVYFYSVAIGPLVDFGKKLRIRRQSGFSQQSSMLLSLRRIVIGSNDNIRAVFAPNTYGKSS
jgi:hypothetical protein